MMSYKAEYAGEDIRVTAADGRVFGWDQELLDEIQSLTSTEITMSAFKAPHPEEKHPELLSVDGASILLVTDKKPEEAGSPMGQAGRSAPLPGQLPRGSE
ncbi:hypothetical protein ACFTAO_28285 [Paenibacillus rhizoplanae]